MEVGGLCSRRFKGGNSEVERLSKRNNELGDVFQGLVDRRSECDAVIDCGYKGMTVQQPM